MALCAFYDKFFNTLASILTHPVSLNASVHQGHVHFSCKAEANELIFMVNNQNADLDSVKNNGFVQQTPENNGQGMKRKLIVFLTKEMAGEVFNISCRAFNVPDLIPADSDNALLQVAGLHNTIFVFFYLSCM